MSVCVASAAMLLSEVLKRGLPWPLPCTAAAHGTPCVTTKKSRRESRGHLRGGDGDEDAADGGVNSNGAHLDALRSLKYLMCFCSISSRMAWSIFRDVFMQTRVKS